MAEDKDFHVEGKIFSLEQTSTPQGIETRLVLERPRHSSGNEAPIISFPSPTGLRLGDYISVHGRRIDRAREFPVGYAETIFHLKDKKKREVLETYKIGY